MRILIFGAGVLGSLYAGRLAAAGQDVALLARGARLEQLQRGGLVLLNEATGREARRQVAVVADLRAEDDYDLIIVAVRAEQLVDALVSLAANRRVPLILFLQNNVLGPDVMTAALGPDRVMLGFPGASGARDGERVRYRLIAEQKTTLGEVSGQITPRLSLIAAMLREAGFPVAISRHMDAWLKTHAVFVTAIAGAIYDAGGSCAGLVAQPGGVERLVRAMRQGFRALRGRGLPIEPGKLALLFLWLPMLIPIAYWRRYLARPSSELVFTRHALAAPAEMQELVRQLRELIKVTDASAPELNRVWNAVEKQAGHHSVMGGG